MKKYLKHILYLVILCFAFNISKVSAADCVQNDAGNGYSNISGSVVCYQYTTGICSAECSGSNGWVRSNESCPAGYHSTGNISSARCYIKDNDCNNIATCVQCAKTEKCTCDPYDIANKCSSESWTESGTDCSSVTCYGAKDCGEMFYCKNKTCYETSSTYGSIGDCNTALTNCNSQPTWGCYGNTGTCYSTRTSCVSACEPTPTPGGGGTPGCINWTCPSVDGQCGSAESGTYSSAAKPSSGLCSDGYKSAVQLTTVGSTRYWKWTCYGYVDN